VLNIELILALGSSTFSPDMPMYTLFTCVCMSLCQSDLVTYAYEEHDANHRNIISPPDECARVFIYQFV
jgi:hypothetical protein